MPAEPMSGTDFVETLMTRVPSARAVVEEHLAFMDGELLLHLLMADVSRFALASFQHCDTVTANAVLNIVDEALRDGDDALVNAVQVSFVEVVGPWEAQAQAFIATWPEALAADAKRVS